MRAFNFEFWRLFQIIVIMLDDEVDKMAIINR